MYRYLIFSIAVHALFVSIILGSTHRCIKCGLTRIPASIPTSITKLYLRENRIRTVTGSSLNALTNIKLFDISRNKLDNVERDSFSGLTIQNLDLSYNQLLNVPHVEPLAYSLKSLDLSNNRILTIGPFAFENFTVLHMLDFAANSINSLPDFAFYAPLTMLSQVHIDGNRLVALNNYTFAGMRANDVFLGHNELVEFPCMNGVVLLHGIDVNGNPISRIPPGCGQWWSKLHKVELTQTRLTSLDNITKYTPELEQLVAIGVTLTLSNETFRNTPKLHKVIIRDVSQFPWFFSNKATLLHVELRGKTVNRIHVEQINGMNAVHTFELRNTSITRFLNLTALGNNNSLRILKLTDNRISSIPCFPAETKLTHLVELVLKNNLINHVCNMNFAPHIEILDLVNNVLIGNIFTDFTNVPLLNLHQISLASNNIERIEDSDLFVIQNCQGFGLKYNKIKKFPNIKFVASNAVSINLGVNLIPDVPCKALSNMENLTTLRLNANKISYVCPLLLALAPKLTFLAIDGNRLVELSDFRVPVRMHSTEVRLNHNLYKCLASLCWMIFVPSDNPLLLRLGNALCWDHEGIKRDMVEGLTTECTCKNFDCFLNIFHILLLFVMYRIDAPMITSFWYMDACCNLIM